MSEEVRPDPERPGVLAVLCDIPFFPGKMGLDFFNLRELAKRHHVGVVGPCYDSLPKEGVQNLRRTVQSCYFWPERLPGLAPDARPGLRGKARFARLLPRSWQRRLLHALVGLRAGDENGLLKLAILANLAPYLLKALEERRWQALIVIQSDTRVWFDYLPTHLPAAVYFHDVRSDYLERRAAYEREPERFRREARLAEGEEREICAHADAIGFVSELDRLRAERRLGALPQASVAEIPLDLDYYHPPAGEAAGTNVLFTGLLSHPPNVDAALFFLEQVWGLVRQQHPQAVFRVAGAFPPQELIEACRNRPGVELHADVPDIRPLFHEAAVYVVPMRFGGGVRQKVLEAWAMRVPMVLTSMAAEGSGAQDGVNCLIADDPAGLARRISELLRRPQAALALVKAGATRVTKRHALEVATPQFERLVQEAVVRRRQRPFRTLLDLSWLWPGTGTTAATAARSLLWALATLDTRNEYRLLAPAASLSQLRLPRSFRARKVALDSWRERTAAWRAGLANELAARLGTHRPMSEGLLRLRFLNRLDCDLVHSFQGVLPSDLDLLPQVRSLHSFLSAPLAQADERERAACLRAELVLCPSELTRQAVHAEWGVPLERLRVVYPALDTGEGAPPDEASRRTQRRQLGLHGDYLLVWLEGPCGDALLEGLALALDSLDPSWDLALVADGLPAGSRAAEGLRARARLVLTPAQLLPMHRSSLLSGARVCVLSSSPEPRDFDRTLAQALLGGGALLVSDHALAREMAGEAVLYAPGQPPEAWSHALSTLLREPERARALGQAALFRAELFSSQEQARRVVAACQAVHAGTLSVTGSAPPGRS